MARADLISKLYSAHKTPLEFQFQSLMAPPLLSLLSSYDIKLLNDLARDPKLSAKLNMKLDHIKQILTPRGFVKFHSGTNRVVYRFLEDQSFLIKIALDKTGLSDNPMEYKNQFLLAPFVTKVFESTPCGTVGLFERVEPITSRQEFVSIAEDVFDLLNDNFIGEYVLEDIGTQYFMNWGIRRGFGPVLLDFPYCYKLDGNKLYCNTIEQTGLPCGGAIDYDNGFNNLICTKCGSKIFAKDLQANINNQKILIKGRKEHSTMKVKVFIPGQEPITKDSTLSAKTYADQVRKSKETLKVNILNNKPMMTPEQEIKQLCAQSKASKELSQKTKDEISKSVGESDHPVETDTTINISERNMNKHQPIIQKSAPYAYPEEITQSSYLEMNKEEDETENTTEKLQEEKTDDTSNTETQTSDKQEESKAVKKSNSSNTANKPRSTGTVRQNRSELGYGNITNTQYIDSDKEDSTLIPNYDSNEKYPAKGKKSNKNELDK